MTVPIAVWFSSALKLASEVITGELVFSSMSFMVTVIFCVSEATPSLTVTVAE